MLDTVALEAYLKTRTCSECRHWFGGYDGKVHGECTCRDGFPLFRVVERGGRVPQYDYVLLTLPEFGCAAFERRT
jgi:hypothetical protein